MVESEKRLIETLSSARNRDDRELALLAAEHGLPPDVLARVASGVGESSSSLTGVLRHLVREGLQRSSRGVGALARQPRAVWLLTAVPAGALGVVSQLVLATSRSVQNAEALGFTRTIGEGLFAASWNWLFTGLAIQLILFSGSRAVRTALLFSASLFANSMIVFGGWHRGIDLQNLATIASYSGFSAAIFWVVLESVAACVRFLCESPWSLGRSRRRRLMEYVEIATSEQGVRRFLHPLAFTLVKHARASLFVCLAAAVASLGALLSRSPESSGEFWTFLWIAGPALMGATFSSLGAALAVASVTFFALFAYSYAAYPFPQTAFMAFFQLVLAPVAMVGLAAGSQVASTKAIRSLRSMLIRSGFYDVELMEILNARRSLAAVGQPAFVVVVDAAKSTEMKANADPLAAELAFRLYQEIIGSTAAQNRGHVLSVVGDGAIVVVQSASDAIGFARRVLEAVEAFNLTSNPLGKPFNLRIGVHHGISQGDVKEVEYSHIIDVAAHIQSRARIGRIMVSESVVSFAPELHATPTGLTADGFKLFEVV